MAAVGDGDGTLREVAFFDTWPKKEKRTTYKGVWSSYVYLPSGNLLISSQEIGLFVVQMADATELGPCFEVNKNPCRRNDECTWHNKKCMKTAAFLAITKAPTTEEFAKCGFMSTNSRKCKKDDDCTWHNKECMTIDAFLAITKAPTTEEFAECGYITHRRQCKKADTCTWTRDKECLTTASIIDAPTSSDETCDSQDNYKRCRRMDYCTWLGSKKEGECVVTTSAPTGAPITGVPTTAEFGACGHYTYEDHGRACKKDDACTWIDNSECMTNGAFAAITGSPTTITAAPTTADFGTCDVHNGQENRCKKEDLCTWIKEGNACVTTRSITTDAPTWYYWDLVPNGTSYIPGRN